MKKITLVLLTLLLSGCIGGGGGPSNAPPASPNEPYTCSNSGANSDCSQSVEPSMY
ncbi:TPA: hypothetical protein ACXJQO_004249 [Serratia marcescens]|nr:MULTISPECIES: hypothetical protein [Serratia]WIF08457.1 hypothetical protein QEP77_10010 [Serratia sp. B1]MCT2270306.1 hypothetical protein [Serratia ureilytica]MDK7592570.1 hypothetical protein [Serratia ureilytica]MDM1817312.1 hypothetical protein [Serratia ureilytica]MDQ1807105.1 hypothetical protein [Serratia ureilytica]